MSGSGAYPRWRLPGVRSVLMLGVIGLALAPAEPAHAQGGLADLFSQLFTPAPQLGYAPAAAVSRPVRIERSSQRERRTHRPRRPSFAESLGNDNRDVRWLNPAPVRVRQAKAWAPQKELGGPLPETRLAGRPATAQPKGVRVQSAKPNKPATKDHGDPVAQVLNDPTLRRGDIVVLPGGAKVFTGERAASSRQAGFEDVRTSRLVGESTRRAVMALRLQPPAAPAQTPIALAAVEQAPGGEERRAEVTGSVQQRAVP